MSEIAYLLGAGASANAIPTVKQIKKVNILKETVKILNRLNSQFTFRYEWNTCYQLIKMFISFDTVAKKLYIKDNQMQQKHDNNKTTEEFTIIGQEFKMFKMFIQVYLAIEQLYSSEYTDVLRSGADLYSEVFPFTTIDERYYPWLLSNIDIDGAVASNNVILSWNYDCQIPLVLKELLDFSAERLLDETFGLKPYYMNGLMINDTKRLNDFFILKTNNLGEITNPNREVNNFIITWINDFYKSPDKVLSIQFAWEIGDSTFRSAAQSITFCETMVIIGYSFPLFNRHWDKIILATFLSSNLKRIIVQDKNPDPIISKIKQIVDELDKFDVEIIPELDLSEFHVPTYIQPDFNK